MPPMAAQDSRAETLSAGSSQPVDPFAALYTRLRRMQDARPDEILEFRNIGGRGVFGWRKFD